MQRSHSCIMLYVWCPVADNILEESPDSPSETEDDYHELDQDDDADDEEDDDDDDDDEV